MKEEWIEVKRKKNNNKKTKNNKKPENNTKPKNKITYRPLSSKYTSLTDNEMEILKNANFNFFCCMCCDADNISDVIGRKLHPCYTCYCCIGDDPLGDNCDVLIGSDGVIVIKSR